MKEKVLEIINAEILEIEGLLREEPYNPYDEECIALDSSLDTLNHIKELIEALQE